MRINQQIQLSFTSKWPEHKHSKELKIISGILDEHPSLNELATIDLCSGKSRRLGRGGMSGEQAIRIGLLMKIHQDDYRELSFHLADSASYRAFARIPIDAKTPDYKTLQNNVKALRAETWEAVNRALLQSAKERGIEKGRKIRTDCTAIGADVHESTDSSLLWDCVRVVTRSIMRAKLLLPSLDWSFFSDRRQFAKRRAFEIKFPRSKKHAKEQQRRSYIALMDVAGTVYAYGNQAISLLEKADVGDLVKAMKVEAMASELKETLRSMCTVLEQSYRRIINNEKVPVEDKLFSIFETHTDIIIKDNRGTVFGHKLCLTGGVSSLILDIVIETGNPADTKLVKRSIERQIEIYQRPPRQASFDGGFASAVNLLEAKALGVKDAVFHKKRGLEITDMAKSVGVFRRLKKFRAGIEGCISALKRAYGLRRCNWKGCDGFKRYTWSSVVAYNAIVLAGHIANS